MVVNLQCFKKERIMDLSEFVPVTRETIGEIGAQLTRFFRTHRSLAMKGMPEWRLQGNVGTIREDSLTLRFSYTNKQGLARGALSLKLQEGDQVRLSASVVEIVRTDEDSYVFHTPLAASRQ
jgi:hypothetical protein